MKTIPRPFQGTQISNCCHPWRIIQVFVLGTMVCNIDLINSANSSFIYFHENTFQVFVESYCCTVVGAYWNSLIKHQVLYDDHYIYGARITLLNQTNRLSWGEQ